MHRKFASKNWISFGEDDLFTGYRMKGKKQQKRCKFNLKGERKSWSEDKQKAPFVKLLNKHNGSEREEKENFQEHKACQRELR